MASITPKNKISCDPHKAIDSKATVQDLRDLAITLFSKKRAYPSQHYAVLNALFDKSDTSTVITLIQRVMHTFFEEQTKLLPIEPHFQLKHFSISSYDKKSHDEILSVIYPGASSTIEDFVEGRLTELAFHDYSFELRMRPFKKLNFKALGLLEKAQERALQAFSNPVLLLLKIKRLYVEVMQDGEAPLLVRSSSLVHSTVETLSLEKATVLPKFSLLYDNELSEDLNRELLGKVPPSKKDVIVESSHVVSDDETIFQFDDFV